jgi:hypothetical protein
VVNFIAPFFNIHKMKKIIFSIFFLCFCFAANAQNYNKFQLNRAKMYSDYVAEQMSMSEEQKQIVYQVLLDRMYNSNAEIKSKNLTMQKDKQVVYAAQTKIAQEKLKSEFGKDSWKILKLSNEARKNAEKK